MSRNEKSVIKIIGNNIEDLKIISTYIQDSLVTVGDIVFLKKNRIFIMLINRFMWENVKKHSKDLKKRIRCAIKFEGIFNVKSKNINQSTKNKSLEFLAIKCNYTSDENYNINFFFSGGGAITLISESIEVIMQDIGNPWIVKHAPKHKI